MSLSRVPSAEQNHLSRTLDATGELLEDACRRATRYVTDIEARRVFPAAAAIAGLEQLGGEMPAEGESPADVLRLLDEVGSAATVATNAGRYFGFVNGAALPGCVAAQWLAAAWDQNAALRVMSPVAAKLEDIVLAWILELFNLPRECGGALVTGATMANLTGLAAARHKLLMDAGWDVESDGLFHAPELTVVLGEEAHVTVRKALGLLGLGRNRVIVVPADGQGRMRPECLPPLNDRTILVLQAGNVNTGSCDPFRALCGVARDAGAWVHIDGAFGLWARVSAAREWLVDGMELADSWATDAHKWLNVPYDCGLALVRDVTSLRAAMTATAAYFLAEDSREPMHHAPESSRRARGVEVWAALRLLGRSGLSDLIRRTCELAQLFAEELRKAGFAVLNDVVLNQVLVSFGDADMTAEVIRRVQLDGTCWCGGTVWKGQAAMRISISSYLTGPEDVAASVRAIRAAAASVKEGAGGELRSQ